MPQLLMLASSYFKLPDSFQEQFPTDAVPHKQLPFYRKTFNLEIVVNYCMKTYVVVFFRYLKFCFFPMLFLKSEHYCQIIKISSPRFANELYIFNILRIEENTK
jgi:hypothetical protein